MVDNRRQRPPKRRKGKKRLTNVNQFVSVYHNVIKSEAWRNCSGDAIKVLMYLCSLSHGKNNGALAASMRTIGEACDISKDKAKRCIDQLLDWGLIEIITPGSWGGRRATEYGIMMWDNYVTGRPALSSWEPHRRTSKTVLSHQQGQ